MSQEMREWVAEKAKQYPGIVIPEQFERVAAQQENEAARLAALQGRFGE